MQQGQSTEGLLLSNMAPRFKKKDLCSSHLSIKFFLLINVEMSTFVGILTFKSRKNSMLSFSEPEKS